MRTGLLKIMLVPPCDDTEFTQHPTEHNYVTSILGINPCFFQEQAFISIVLLKPGVPGSAHQGMCQTHWVFDFTKQNQTRFQKFYRLLGIQSSQNALVT